MLRQDATGNGFLDSQRPIGAQLSLYRPFALVDNRLFLDGHDKMALFWVSTTCADGSFIMVAKVKGQGAGAAEA